MRIRKTRIAGFIIFINLVEAVGVSYWPQLYGDPDPFGMLLNSAISYAVFGVNIIFVFSDLPRFARMFSCRRYLLFMGLFLVCALGVVTSPDRIMAARGLLKVVLQFLVAAYAMNFYRVQFMETLYRFALFFAVANIAYIAALPAQGMEHVNSLRSGDWRGLLLFKTYLGVFSVMLASYVYVYVRTSGRKFALLDMAGIALLVVLAIGSQSRTAWLMLPLAILLSFFYSHCRIKNRTAIAAAIVMLAIFVVLSPIVQHLFSDIVRMAGRDLTFTGRTDIWAYFIAAIRDGPVFGYGIGVFFTQPDLLERARYAVGFETFASAHSSFLEWGLNAGLVGMGLFAAIVIEALYAAYRTLGSEISSAARPFAPPLAVCVGGLLMTSFGGQAGFPLLLLFCVLASRALARRGG